MLSKSISTKKGRNTMTKTKHTPGPWFLRPDRLLKKGSLERHEVISNNGLSIALPIGGLHDQEEKLANSRLIAAAPDLLAALEALKLNLSGCKDNYFRAHAAPIINAAIAKAKGTSQ